MSARAQCHDRFAREEIVGEMLHLIIRPSAKAQQHDAQIRRSQRLHARLVVLRVWFDLAILDGEKHGAFEPVMNRQNLGQLRHAFLGPILLIPGQEDDVLALAGTFRAFVGHPVARQRGLGQDTNHQEQS